MSGRDFKFFFSLLKVIFSKTLPHGGNSKFHNQKNAKKVVKKSKKKWQGPTAKLALIFAPKWVAKKLTQFSKSKKPKKVTNFLRKKSLSSQNMS